MSNSVSLEQAASLTGRSPTTIKSWIRQGGDEFVVERAERGRAWRIDMPALLRWRERQLTGRPRRGVPEAPDDLPDPLDFGAMIMARLILFRTRRIVAHAAVNAGTTDETAVTVADAVTRELIEAVREIGHDMRIEPFASAGRDADFLDPEGMEPIEGVGRGTVR